MSAQLRELIITFPVTPASNAQKYKKTKKNGSDASAAGVINFS